MDKLKCMQVFTCIAKYQSFTEAAKVLHTSLASVVRRQAELEQHLGVKLLNRTTRQVALTFEGTQYLQHCKWIFEALDIADGSVNQDPQSPSGTITLAANEAFGVLMIAPLLAQFSEVFPHIKVQTVLNNAAIDLLKQGIDFSFQCGVLNDSSLVAKQIGTIRQLVVASPDLVAKYPRLKHPTDLSGLPCGQYFENSAEKQWTFTIDGKTLAVPIHGPLATTNADVGLVACKNGLIFGRFFDYQVCSELQSGELVEVLTEYPEPDNPVSVVYPSAKLQPERSKRSMQWFADKLSAKLAR